MSPPEAISSSVSGSVRCPACGIALAPATSGATICGACNAHFETALFPALNRKIETALPEAISANDEASCFYHAENKAVVACSGCGRFLCSLCDLEVKGAHICPACLERTLTADANGGKGGKTIGKKSADETATTLVKRRFCHARMATMLTLWPLLLGFMLWPFFVVSGSAGLVFSILGWRRPGSLVKGKRKISLVFTTLLALLEIGGGIAFIVLIISALVRDTTHHG